MASNWVRTLQSIPPYWEAQRKSLYAEIGDPENDLEYLRETSPLFHADKATKPLIVLQGANDPRVIKPESDEIVEAIKKKNGVVELSCSITRVMASRRRTTRSAPSKGFSTFWTNISAATGPWLRTTNSGAVLPRRWMTVGAVLAALVAAGTAFQEKRAGKRTVRVKDFQGCHRRGVATFRTEFFHAG